MVKLYVEGGGDSAGLKSACRKGFSAFLEKAGFNGHMPRIVACGSRQDAFNSFCTAVKQGETAFLLVDSEESITSQCQQGDDKTWLPWLHLAQRQGDKWQKPDAVDDLQCHLMVQCMESWFLADRQALKTYFGQGFQENQLPAIAQTIESIDKLQVYESLLNATRNCKTKAKYSKGDHSFKILALIDSTKVIAASPWVKRFTAELKNKMGVESIYPLDMDGSQWGATGVNGMF